MTIDNIKDIIEEIDNKPEKDKNERMLVWREMLNNALYNKTIFVKNDYIFIAINSELEDVQALIDLDLITENSFHFANIPDDVIDDCKALLIMYEMFDVVGLPIITMYIPATNIPKEVQSLFADALTVLHKTTGFTTDDFDDTLEIEE